VNSEVKRLDFSNATYHYGHPSNHAGAPRDLPLGEIGADQVVRVAFKVFTFEKRQ
jgi:hypothetical protein